MKTRNQFLGFIAIAIMAIAIIGCKEDEPTPPPAADTPTVQPDTPRTLSFNTPCTVTIKSDDQFTATEWKTLCDKTVAAIERGFNAYGSNVIAKNGQTTFFTNNTVFAVLLKSATYDAEVKSTVPKTMYFKANASAIDGLTGENIAGILNAVYSGGTGHIP